VSKHKIRRGHEEFEVVEDTDDLIPLATDLLSKRCKSPSQMVDHSSDSDNAILFGKAKRRRKVTKRRAKKKLNIPKKCRSK
jgi:hypothetical protein